MTFVFAFALSGLLLIGAPYFAHRLRRRRAETRPFAPTLLVPPAPPRARRRSDLEDRSLFAIRALAVIALALLGASPFVRCSRLSLARSSGASVALAIVLDDSMSMRASGASTTAAKGHGKTRLARAKEGASELLASTREGDAVAVILAGDPARIALAPTTDLAGARALLESIPESDRGTDLDGALALAKSLVLGMPQVDRRVVVLSDLADGKPEGAPLGEGSSVPIWNALPELRSDGYDCAILRADRASLRVRVRVACTPGAAASSTVARTIGIYLGDKLLVEGAAPTSATGDIVLTLPQAALSSGEPPGALIARLRGTDAIAIDDSAPVVPEAAAGSVAVVVEAESETAATGGAPVVEQALNALQLDVTVRPLPQIPDRTDDLGAFVGVILDDPPGLTPEERRAVGAFVERGGVLLLALGPRAASPPLGASLAPFLGHPVTWETTTSLGADPDSASGALAESASGLRNLEAHRRVILDPLDLSAFTPLVAWSDHAPLVTRRTLGRGEVWVVTLPFALDASELPLRPAFLALLETWVDAAHARTVPRRTVVGVPWTFAGARKITIIGPNGEELPVPQDATPLRAAPSLLGLYRLDVDGRTESRVVQPAPREVDLRPRKLAVAAAVGAFGENHGAVDASPFLAIALLAFVTLELALRVGAGRRADRGLAVAAGSGRA
jgi:hypothetical protein